MTHEIKGIHHVTAIASDPQRNVDFYAGALGLRLVKKTVNFDDPTTYHLYYGDGEGRPGTILTFFPWPGARRGSRGVGQVTTTAFAVPEGSIGFWVDRFAKEGIAYETPKERFDEEVLTFLDPDGLRLELVTDRGAADFETWAGGGISGRHALRGFHSVTLDERRFDPTAELLGTLGLELEAQQGNRYRFRFAEDRGRLDVVHSSDGGFGRGGAGTVHHVALRVAGDPGQVAWQQQLSAAGQGVTEVKDRNYFRSIYFRETGGVLFEIATDPPGFTVDEPLEQLGSHLKLPTWLEPHRQRLEQQLPGLTVPSLAVPSIQVEEAGI